MYPGLHLIQVKFDHLLQCVYNTCSYDKDNENTNDHLVLIDRIKKDPQIQLSESDLFEASSFLEMHFLV